MSRITIVLLTLLALALAACSRTTAVTTNVEPVDLTIEATEFGFSPDLIEVTAGQPVRLTLNNVGVVEHDWSISHIRVANVREHSIQSAGHGNDMHGKDPDLHVAVMTGQSGVVEFTPIEPGKYEIACTVAGHKEAGMVGTLVVKAQQP